MKRFSTFSLDTANQCLWRGTEPIHLSPKAYSLLSYLVENANRLVTKEELLETLWPDTFVTDGVLKVNILELRKALGETSLGPKHIVTVHRRGYRFVGDVHDEMIA